MKYYRIITLLLIVAMAIGLASCAGGDGGGASTMAPNNSDGTSALTDTPITQDAEPLNEAIEDLDYDGRAFNIISRSKKDEWSKGELASEELNNEPVNDAIYNRNINVEEMLGIKINVLYEDDLQNKVRQAVTSGDASYDVVADSVAYGTPLINEGSYYNLYGNGIDTYLDSSKPWWSQKWIEEAEMGDRLYCITGSLALSLKRLIYATYYNKTMAESNNLENMYDVVRDGRWTIDYESELINSLYRDLNGNDTVDGEDSFGLLINHYECVDMFWSCFDMDFLAKDSENWFAVNLNNEKLANAFEKVYALVYQNRGTFDFLGTAYFGDACKMFAQGQSLFASLHLKWAETETMRNMQDDYGFLPQPKYDEAQKEYYSYAHDQYTVFMVPITVEDPELCGAALEALAYESYKSVDYMYYNLSLRGRYANDADARQMLDILVDGFVVDAAWIYGRQLGQPAAAVFRDLINSEQQTFASAYARVSRSLPAGLKDMREKIEKMDY